MPNTELPTTVIPPALSLETDEQESPAAPAIPSFASLRGPRGRSAVDVLVPRPSPGPQVPPIHRPAAGTAPRPAEYADLVRLGMHVVRAAVGVPRRVVGWAAREPLSCLRRLLGG